MDKETERKEAILREVFERFEELGVDSKSLLKEGKDVKKKAALATEIAQIIQTSAGNREEQATVLQIVVTLLLGRCYRIACSE
jgi:hypothetical protein